ncbi:GNAT family N-acetyltransferase [Photobacterium kasasachensis]
MGYGPYAVELKKTGELLGIVGFFYPAHWPEPEIKWALARKYWGFGFAKEAAQAVQRIGSKYIPQISLISFIHSQNGNSIGLAYALGATFEKEMLFRGDQTWHVYRHPTVT